MASIRAEQPSLWPDLRGRLGFGGDYNPEQWPEEVWSDDVALMLKAGVTFVTVGVFSWSLLESEEGRFEFGWLDRVLDLLGDAGIAVDLATGTASPPPWLTSRYPQVLPVLADGTTQWPGSRQSWCPSSPIMRERTVTLARAMGERYGDHPALAMWHVSNEYGCHNALCHCEVSAAAFRRWLTERYCSLDALNDAWGTRVWSQTYTSFEQVLPPRVTPTFRNPAQVLDYRRFTSDELLACYRAERDVLRTITPDVPITTNFMVMAHFFELDYWRWAEEVDVVSNDHYVAGAHPRPPVELAMSADIVRGLAGGKPWFLMENATSAVSWQPRNLAKTPGAMARDTWTHIAHGADAIGFFQWRQAEVGAERWHSAMLPHAGTESRRWREVEALGADLEAAHDVLGSTVVSSASIMFDFQAWWATLEPGLPSQDLDYRAWVEDVYTGFHDLGVTVDMVRPGAPLAHPLVVVPALYLMRAQAAEALAAHVSGGGRVVVTAFSGIVDQNDRVYPGAYPAVLRQMLGIAVEEFFPLPLGGSVTLDDGRVGTVWSEEIRLEGAQALANYRDGPVAGGPAITRTHHGEGSATYVSTRLASADWATLLAEELRTLGQAVQLPPAGVHIVERRRGDVSFKVVVNHGENPVELPLAGVELSSGRHGGSVNVAGGAVAVVRLDR